MNDNVNQEFQRILGNPENEIISESLKSRLGPAPSAVDFNISFEGDIFECTLDSFSMDSSLGLSRVSLLIGLEPVGLLLSGKEFEVNCSAFDIYITSSNLGSVDCFKYNSDTYVLELSVIREGVIND